MHRRMTWVLRRYWFHTLVSKTHLDFHNDSEKGTLNFFKYLNEKSGTNILCSKSKQIMALPNFFIKLVLTWLSVHWKWELSEETLKLFQCFYLPKLSVKNNRMPKMSCWLAEWHSRAATVTSSGVSISSHAERGQHSALLQHAASGKYSDGQSLLSFPAKSTCCHQYQFSLCPFPSTERTVWYMDSLNK